MTVAGQGGAGRRLAVGPHWTTDGVCWTFTLTDPPQPAEVAHARRHPPKVMGRPVVTIDLGVGCRRWWCLALMPMPPIGLAGGLVAEWCWRAFGEHLHAAGRRTVSVLLLEASTPFAGGQDGWRVAPTLTCNGLPSAVRGVAVNPVDGRRTLLVVPRVAVHRDDGHGRSLAAVAGRLLMPSQLGR